MWNLLANFGNVFFRKKHVPRPNTPLGTAHLQKGDGNHHPFAQYFNIFEL